MNTPRFERERRQRLDLLKHIPELPHDIIPNIEKYDTTLEQKLANLRLLKYYRIDLRGGSYIAQFQGGPYYRSGVDFLAFDFNYVPNYDNGDIPEPSEPYPGRIGNNWLNKNEIDDIEEVDITEITRDIRNKIARLEEGKLYRVTQQMPPPSRRFVHVPGRYVGPFVGDWIEFTRITGKGGMLFEKRSIIEIEELPDAGAVGGRGRRRPKSRRYKKTKSRASRKSSRRSSRRSRSRSRSRN